MEFTRAELKAQAKEQLAGKVWKLFLCTLVACLPAIIVSSIQSASTIANGGVPGPFASMLTSVINILITPALSLGLIMVYLNVTYGDEPQVSTVFEPFKRNYGKTIALTLLVGLFVILWTCLFIIPGIIMAYAYSQACYILAENPDMSAMDCIRESKRIMKGRKMDLFILELSFLPWALLVIVTAGIASIYVTPYMSLTMTNFYHRIKKGGDQAGDYSTSATDTITDIIENASDKVEATVENVTDHIN
ncbi:MAG: DUF975 family protein [Lachnospiraceae bacterium]|nr:DUF975 family protein [Lachnospiraceae bacterium]